MPRGRKPRPVSVAVFQSDGRWVGFVTVGTRPDGKPDRRKRSGKTCPACIGRDDPKPACGCRAAVEEKIRQLEDELAAGRVARPGRKPTVQEWFTTWLTEIAPYGRRPLRPRTLDDYWSKCRTWVFPAIGSVRLDALGTDELDKLYATMNRHRWVGPDGQEKKLAPATVLKVHAIIRRGLAVALQRGKVVRNVAEIIDPPGSPSPKRKKALTVEQAQQIVNVIERRRNALRWKVGLAIGPRQGEALGLHWDQVDLDAGTVEIAWQVQRRTWRHGCADPHACGYRKGTGKPPLHREPRPPCPGSGPVHDRYHRRGCPPPRKGCPPKCTRHAASCPQRIGGGLVMARPKTYVEGETEHTVALPPSLVAELREHRRAQLRERLAAGELWEDHGLVFCRPNGRPIDPRQDWEEWQSILREAGMEDTGTHVMRHTAATLLLDLGVDLAVVQEILGHSDVRTTRGYTKVKVGLTRRAARKMDGTLFKPRPATDLATRRQLSQG